jgi:hypothetical protein
MRFRTSPVRGWPGRGVAIGWQAACPPMADLFVPNPVRSDAGWCTAQPVCSPASASALIRAESLTGSCPGKKTDLGITDEDLQDLIRAMVSSNTETNITVTYDETNGKLNFVVSTAPPTERSITAAGSTAAYTDRIVADTTSAAFSLRLPAAASGQLPFVITNIGPDLLTLTGTVIGKVNPTVRHWSSRTIASNSTILYFT